MDQSQREDRPEITERPETVEANDEHERGGLR